MASVEGTRKRGASTITHPGSPPARTIEEIEARAAVVQEEEQAALRALAACIREIAVRLPVESRLPLDLAQAANGLDLFSTGSSQRAGVLCALFAPTGLIGAIETYMPQHHDR